MAAAAIVLLGSCWGALVVVTDTMGGKDAPRDYTEKLCGNAICDRHAGESCRSCAKDCGPCDSAAPELVAVAPESGTDKRWILLFGTNLDKIRKVWLSRAGRLTALELRRKSTRLEAYVPAGSQGGTIHVEVAGKRSPTPLRYTVRRP
ncbi:MAG: hypothetical protein ABI333_28890 [bacterium]